MAYISGAGALVRGGIFLCLAASPPVATRIGLDPFHFVNRQIMFLLPAVAVMVATSFLSPRDVRRLAALQLSAILPLHAGGCADVALRSGLASEGFFRMRWA